MLSEQLSGVNEDIHKSVSASEQGILTGKMPAIVLRVEPTVSLSGSIKFRQ